jgi:hypothetical protein
MAATELSELGTPWGFVAQERLEAAISANEINRRDREGKMLLGLPRTSDAIPAWLKQMRLADDNPDYLADAARYGLGRLRELSTAAGLIADSISAIDEAPTQECVRRLRALSNPDEPRGFSK